MKKKPKVWLARDERSGWLNNAYVIALGSKPIDVSDQVGGCAAWRGEVGGNWGASVTISAKAKQTASHSTIYCIK